MKTLRIILCMLAAFALLTALGHTVALGQEKKEAEKDTIKVIDDAVKDMAKRFKELEDFMAKADYWACETKILHLSMDALKLIPRGPDATAEDIKTARRLLEGLFTHMETVHKAEAKRDLKAARKAVVDAESLFRDFSKKLQPKKIEKEKKKQ